MPQHTFRNAFKLLKAKQHKWKRSVSKKFAWLKTNSKLHIRNLDIFTTTKSESYPLPTIRATRRFPIDDFSDSEEEEENLAAESSSSSSPDDGSNSNNESTSSSKVYDVPPSCQNSPCSTLSLASASQTETETSSEIGHSNVPERPEPEVLNTSGRFSSFGKSTCTASTRDSHVTAASYLDPDSVGDEHEDEDEDKHEDGDEDKDEDEDDPGPGPGLNGDENIQSDTSATSFFESQDSQSDTSTTSASSISC